MDTQIAPSKDFFVSYTQTDLAWAKWLDFFLNESGYTTIMQHYDFRHGDNFVEAMNEALKICERVIAVVSNAYLKSHYCNIEWTSALAQSKLTLVRVEKVKPTGALAAQNYIDLVGADPDKTRQLLLDGLNPRDRPTKEPPLPDGRMPIDVGPEPPFPGAVPSKSVMRLFLSSAADDALQPHKEAVRRAFNDLGDWECLPPRSQGSIDEQHIWEQLDSSDLFVAFVGHEYGRVIENREPQLSLTEKEYDTARSLDKKKCILMLRDDNRRYPNAGTDERQKLFRARIQGDGVVDIDGKPQDVANALIGDLPNLLRAPENAQYNYNDIPTGAERLIGRSSQIGNILLHVVKGENVALWGMAGVGKTAIALSISQHHSIIHHFRKRIIVDLRGEAEHNSEELFKLSLYKIDPETRTSKIENWQSAFGRAIADGPVLFILDDAKDGRSVKAFVEQLPRGNVALITSQKHLFPDRVCPIEIGVLSRQDAVELLRTHLGERDVPEEALALLAERCGWLPLALAAVGSDLREHRNLDIDHYALESRMLDQLRRLAGRDVPEALLGMVVRMSANAEDKDTVRFWQKLTVFPSHFDAAAAAEVVACHETDAAKYLDKLADYSLLTLERSNPPRYRVHTLLRNMVSTVCGLTPERQREWSAVLNAVGFTPDQQRELAITHMRHSARFKNVLGECNNAYRQGVGSVGSGEHGIPDSLARFDLEWPNISAGQQWARENVKGNISDIASEYCVEYCIGNFEILDLRLTAEQRISWLQAAWEVVSERGDDVKKGQILDELGVSYRESGNPKKALPYHRRALRITRSLGNRILRSSVLGNLGRVYWELGKGRAAGIAYGKALQIAEQSPPDKRQQEEMLDCLGIVYREAQWAAALALDMHQRAEAIASDIREPRGTARALDNQGLDYLRLGDQQQAIERFEKSLAISLDIGDIALMASVLDHLSEAYRWLGNMDQALEFGDRAMDAAMRCGDLRVVERAKGNRGLALLNRGSHADVLEAEDLFLGRVDLTREKGDKAGECAASYHVGLVYDRRGVSADALRYCRHSLKLACELPKPDIIRNALQLILRISLVAADPRSTRMIAVSNKGVMVGLDPEAAIHDDDILHHLPYGSMTFPVATTEPCSVLVVKQPGVKGRKDVLVIEKPVKLAVWGGSVERCRDPRPGFDGKERLRVVMEQLKEDAGDQPASVAVLLFAYDSRSFDRIDGQVPVDVAAIRYSVRPGDVGGWFEFGDDAFPEPTFCHGHPDIATRDQGEAGIRGPSRPAMGLQAPIDSGLFAPQRSSPLDPGERAIYELHIGTFTPEGTFSAATDRLSHVKEMGFSTIQLLPLDLTSGMPGWSYDQTRTGTVERAYGGADGLIRFVEQAHRLGIEVIVDKQYNHEGPEQDSRGQIIPGMFGRQTKWGAGLSGRESPHYDQVIKLLGEEMAYWVQTFGIDGFRFDATNRLPIEVHQSLADLGRALEQRVGKPLYLLSEYAEGEAPMAQRVPTGRQYADQPGRLLMKLLGLSKAAHVTRLQSDGGSTLRAMLKAARRGWWYPDLSAPQGGLSGIERSTTLLWNHDWIGNRFGGERISQLVSFAQFKTITVWQALGQWTPLIFMGTERYSKNPWYFFTGHRDDSTKNNTSAYYQDADGTPVLRGGRFLEFRQEAEAIGLREALAFSTDGTVAGIDWQAFRGQEDKNGKPYMDHANEQAFLGSKMTWDEPSAEQVSVGALFKFVLQARSDDRIKEPDPELTQYKGWEQSERVFVLRRRSRNGRELIALFNLGQDAKILLISSGGVQAQGIGRAYVVALSDDNHEEEWGGRGRFWLWLDTNAPAYGGQGSYRNMPMNHSQHFLSL